MESDLGINPWAARRSSKGKKMMAGLTCVRQTFGARPFGIRNKVGEYRFRVQRGTQIKAASSAGHDVHKANWGP